MNSSRPYLLKAFYDWITDNDLTPYIVVDTDNKDVVVPAEYIEDDKIILNISTMAVNGLELESSYIAFEAKFAGLSFDVYAPMEYVSAIYAKENGRGMVFKDEFEDDFPPDDGGDDDSAGAGGNAPAAPSKSKKGRPNLRVVK